jgi:hypothetical protein
VPFGDSPIEFRNDDDTEINYSKEMAEAISFAHLAVATHIDGMIVNIDNRQPPTPDLYVELSDGSHVYVEVGQIVASESARYVATIAKVNQHLMGHECDEPAYLDEIHERHLSVQIPLVATSRRTRAVADEIVALLRSLDFR